MEHTIYLICAIVGCTIVVLQIVLQAFGLFGEAEVDAGDMDVDVDVDVAVDADTDAAGPEGHGNVFFGFLSFKALCAFVGIFGLVGLALFETKLPMQGRIALSFASGVAGMLLVGWMMRGLAHLQASGTVNLRNAVGRTATVYLRIPAEGRGHGKVTVEVQGRSMEINAVTDGEELPTGTRVTVLAMEGDDTLKVVPL
jgi:membrane protein implicated in regulation of membrane protease activity